MPGDRKVFHDSIVPIPVESGLAPTGMIVNSVTPEHRDEEMTIHFSLALPVDARADLEEKVARGEAIDRSELQSKYGVNEADVDSLVAWLRDEGYKVIEISPDNTSVYASASVTQIEQSLDVNMVRVAHKGMTYTAASSAPSLPMSVGAAVQSIGGLQPFRQAHKHARRKLPKDVDEQSFLEDGALKKNVGHAPPYLVADILRAYDADALGVDGSGQTIAILIDTFPSDSDLAAFWKANGLAVNLGRVQRINVKAGTLDVPSGEETLDAQWTSGIAPGATIRIYASGSLQFVDLDRALDRILADLPTMPGLRQLSISLGLGETYMNGPGGEVAVQHQKFLQLAAAGVNVFVSTGDAGSNPDETGQSSTGPLQVEYESSDPCVVAVGGTSLVFNSDGSVKSEMGWTQGGGGRSIFFQRPAWQTGNDSRRLVPDVAAAADPKTGGLVILHGKALQYGGTSWSAPIWAGICALINDARSRKGKSPLPFINPLLYPRVTTCFRDVVTGSNGAYKAIAGFDLVTGLGVPNVRALVQALTA